MKIVICGNGKVGHSLAGQLAQEGHELIVIEKKKDYKKIEADFDIIYVEGNGASYDVQLMAGVPDADLLIAVTSQDEVNILCCLIAKKLGAKSTIARVRDPEYHSQLHHLQEELHLSMVINPELTAATEINNIIHNPSAIDIDSLAGGKVQLVEIRVAKDSPIAGKKVMEINIPKLNKYNICCVEREEEAYIPNGSFVIQAGDKLNIAIESHNLPILFRGLGLPTHKISRVFIVGGSRIAYYLARKLRKDNIKVRILEKNIEKCAWLSSELDGVTVIHGDGSAESVLLAEGAAEADCFIALTNVDEENLFMGVYAQHFGAKKVITKMNRLSFLGAFSHVTDTVISPKVLTSEQIVKYVRSMNASSEEKIRAYYTIGGGIAETVEFLVDNTLRYLRIPFKSLPIREGVLVACIIRKGSTIIPKGDDHIQMGDIVVVVSKNQSVKDLNDIFV